MRRVVLRDITAISLCLAVVTHNIKYSCYVPKPLTAQQHSGQYDIQRETADLDQKGKVHVAQI